MGCGRKWPDRPPDFHLLDRFDPSKVPIELRRSYTQLDIVSASPRELDAVGTYDLVRMQHVLEHMPYEDGQAALRNCGRLLAPGGTLLITVPDLRVQVAAYLEGRYTQWDAFARWAQERIPPDAPDSFYFSIFAHSMPGQHHEWCYDFEGVAYLLNATGMYSDIRRLPFDDPVAEYPFTHNRPDEDVCVLAQRI